VSRSWMIGDSTADIEAAKNFGIRSVLVSGAVTIRDAVDQILNA
jgi:phosphoglycolate phosphatase-like HAD superfamily hydrolase